VVKLWESFIKSTLRSLGKVLIIYNQISYIIIYDT
jgi:hypothetical protein